MAEGPQYTHAKILVPVLTGHLSWGENYLSLSFTEFKPKFSPNVWKMKLKKKAKKKHSECLEVNQVKEEDHDILLF